MIYSDSSHSWLEYAQKLSNKEDIYARFIISYIALLVFCSKNKLYSDHYEIDIYKIDKKYNHKYINIDEKSKIKLAIDELILYFKTAGVKSLQYPSYPSKDKEQELHRLDKWGEVGNAVNFVMKVRNNLIHGGKEFDADEHSRNFKLVKLALDIIEGLNDSLFNK